MESMEVPLICTSGQPYIPSRARQGRPKCNACGATLRSNREGCKKGYCDPCARTIKRGNGKLTDERSGRLDKAPKKSQQFCLRGHDTWHFGRSKRTGSCRQCLREDSRAYEARKRGESGPAKSAWVAVPHLKQLREEKGWTENKAVEETGVEKKAYRLYEKGKRKPLRERAMRMAKGFSVPLSALTGKEE